MLYKYGHSALAVRLGYLRGLEIPGLRLEDMPKGCDYLTGLKTNVMRYFIAALACLISVRCLGSTHYN